MIENLSADESLPDDEAPAEADEPDPVARGEVDWKRTVKSMIVPAGVGLLAFKLSKKPLWGLVGAIGAFLYGRTSNALHRMGLSGSVTSYELFGYVTRNKVPVTNAWLSLGPWKVKTDSKGYYKFANVPVGKWKVAVWTPESGNTVLRVVVYEDDTRTDLKI